MRHRAIHQPELPRIRPPFNAVSGWQCGGLWIGGDEGDNACDQAGYRISGARAGRSAATRIDLLIPDSIKGEAISSPKSIEIILARQLASCLAMPICIVDAEGTLIFYNEPAEAILNQRFEETGDMPAGEWGEIFALTDVDGNPVPREEWPLVMAYTKQQAVSRIVWMRCRDDAWRNINFTAFPIIGQAGQFLGALSIFWEV